MKNLALSTLMCLVFISCAKVYTAPGAPEIIKRHKKIAVLPPNVHIEPNKRITPENLILQQKAETVTFQQEIYSWILKRKMQNKITQDIQDINTTNAILKEAGYPENPLGNEKLCTLLGVDGVLHSNFYMAKPMSTGAVLALGLLVGVWGNTNEVKASMSITDCLNQEVLWNYNHSFSGSIGSTPERLVDGLMRNASRKMPYIIKVKPTATNY